MSRAVGFGMRTLTKFLVGLLLLCSGAARAQNVDTQWSFSAVNYADAQAACGAWAATLGPGYSALPPTLYGAKPDRVAGCNYTRPDNTTGGPNNVGVSEHCPAGATWNATALSCVGSNPCASKSGQAATVNRTEGWAASNNPNTPLAVSTPPASATMCESACVVNASGVDQCYRSQMPAANGMHRVSCDYKGTYSGAVCTTSPSAPENPAASPPPCPGFQGNVNGKPVCVGAGSTPLPAAPSPSPLPETPGNPAAGAKPATGTGAGGDGAGRTPTTGTGGNTGGGSNAAIPGGGSSGNGQGNGAGGAGPGGAGGTGTSPIGDIEFPDTCGLPGKPPCKIDETGTHNGQGVYTSANSAWDAAKQAELDGLNSPTHKLQTVPWMWGFSLPTASCSVWHFTFKGHDYTVDVCGSSAANLWRSAWAWAVYVMGALYLWRRLTSAAPGGK
jgi:hypothetical protein